METDHFSRTAWATAFMRSYHAAHDHPKIFDDFMAHLLLTEEELRIIAESQIESFRRTEPEQAASCPDRAGLLDCWMHNGAPQPLVLARARYTEDNLVEAIKGQGITQYVILGAGLDTFALRRPDLLAKLQVFEVDHPATQATKRQRLLAVAGKLPSQLHLVAVDFAKQDLTTRLLDSAYDPDALSFFNWLGVTYYLSREAILDTLRAIAEAAPAGSKIIFDYLDIEAFIPGQAARRVQNMMQAVAHLGEPMITGLDPATLAADLAGLGLRLKEDLNPSAIQERFFAGRRDGYHSCEHAHYALVVVA